MATQPRIAFSAVRTLNGMSIPKEEFGEVASSTFKKGAPCVIDANGFLAECGADPALIMGLATRDGQNNAVDDVKKNVVELAAPGVLFLGNFDNGSASQAGAVTRRSEKFGIAKHGGTGKWYVDSTDTTNKRVVLWNYWDQDSGYAVGDNLSRWLFQFDPIYFQGHVST